MSGLSKLLPNISSITPSHHLNSNHLSHQLNLSIGGRNQPISTLNNQLSYLAKAPGYHRQPKHINEELISANQMQPASLSQDARLKNENFSVYEQVPPITIQQIRN